MVSLVSRFTTYFSPVNFSNLGTSDQDIQEALSGLHSNPKEFVGWVNRNHISIAQLNLSPDDFRNLSGFTHLNLRNTSYSHEVIERIIDSSPNLTNLNLSNTVVTHLKKLPESLKFFEAASCLCLVELPENLPFVLGFTIRNCFHIKSLPNLPRAIEVDISHCKNIEVLPEGMVNLAELNCTFTSIRKFPESMPQVETIHCFCCENLQGRPEHAPKLATYNDKELVSDLEEEMEFFQISEIRKKHWWENFNCCPCLPSNPAQPQEMDDIPYFALVDDDPY